MLEAELEAVSFACCTIDFWTSLATESYLGVTVHYIDANWVLHSRMLESRTVDVRHNADNVAQLLREFQLHWKLRDKVVSYVTDNAPNMVKAVVSELGGGQVRCTAHSLQRGILKGLFLRYYITATRYECYITLLVDIMLFMY
jgi:hypothetical protein